MSLLEIFELLQLIKSNYIENQIDQSTLALTLSVEASLIFAKNENIIFYEALIMFALSPSGYLKHHLLQKANAFYIFFIFSLFFLCVYSSYYWLIFIPPYSFSWSWLWWWRRAWETPCGNVRWAMEQMRSLTVLSKPNFIQKCWPRRSF